MTTRPHGTRRDVPVALMRGGTSKGVFLRLEELPPPGEERDRFLLSLMGSPDPMQLDGLGGTHSSTSKVVAVTTRDVPSGIDVAYLFAQVGVDRAVVDQRGNCGNLTAAVAPYALGEGIVAATDPLTTVRLLNLNTGQRVHAHVPTADGSPLDDGDFVLDGVPGTAARIDLEFVAPLGGVTGEVLPTGAAVEDVAGLRATIIDVTTPVVCVAAADLGVRGDERPADLTGALGPELARIRADAAVRLGLADRPERADAETPAIPRVALISAPGPSAAGADVVARMTSMGVVHHALPGTGTLAIAAAARLPGTVVHALAPPAPPAPAPQSPPTDVRVAHPKGVATVTVKTGPDGLPVSVALPRTARRLLTGVAHLR